MMAKLAVVNPAAVVYVPKVDRLGDILWQNRALNARENNQPRGQLCHFDGTLIHPCLILSKRCLSSLSVFVWFIRSVRCLFSLSVFFVCLYEAFVVVLPRLSF